MPYTSTKFDIRGIDPKDDPLWSLAGEKVHREFWKVVVGLVKIQKDKDLAKGLDRHGFKLKRITKYTYEHRHSEMGVGIPSNPPLVPAANGASRTRAYFDGRAFADHAEFFWRNGWGRILAFHRAGAWNVWAGRPLPVRDVIGLSPASVHKVEMVANQWWKVRRRTVFPEPIFEPATIKLPAFQPVPKLKIHPPPPRIAPPKIAVRGRTDIENAIFPSEAARQRAKQAIAGGYHTGYGQAPIKFKKPSWMQGLR